MIMVHVESPRWSANFRFCQWWHHGFCVFPLDWTVYETGTNLKIICQFHAYPLHQNSVDIVWAEIYRRQLFLGSNLVHEYQITAHPYGVDVISSPPYCTRVSKDTGSISCERKIFRPSIYIFVFDISNISDSFAGILSIGMALSHSWRSTQTSIFKQAVESFFLTD
jgi:hypothetical protein